MCIQHDLFKVVEYMCVSSMTFFKVVEYMCVSSMTFFKVVDALSIPAKPLNNCGIVSEHFNHFYYMGICDKITRHLSMLPYTYLNVDECSLTSSMH